MALKFEITGDNSNLLSSLDGAREGVRRTAQDIEESGMGIEDMFKRIAATAGIAFSVDAAKSFIGKITEMRAYFQDIESSMEVFLGNQQKAADFTQKLKDYAYYNMFEFKDLAQASKQMIAYGQDVESIIPTLDKLSNIATGTQAPLLDLVAAYNKAKNIGKLGANELASWAVKGVVVTDVLKEMGEEVDGTTVTFEQLNKVLDKVTGEGGMFHDLMLNQMSNISAEQGQLEDNLAAMYNEIGEEYQDFITGAIKAESWLVDHYKEVSSVIIGLIASYGEYQAALRVTRAIENSMTKQANGIESTRQNELSGIYSKYSDNSDIMAIGQETAAEEANTTAILQNTASRQGNVTAIDEQIAALERKMLAEIDDYDKVMESAQAAIDTAKSQEDAAQEQIDTLTRQAETAREFLEMRNEEVDAAIKSGDAKEIETARTNYNIAAKEEENIQRQLATANTQKEEAAGQRLIAEKNLETAASRKTATQEKLTNFQKAVNVTQTKAQTAATGLWVAMTKSATATMNSLKVAMMTNPFGVALAAITTIVSLLPIFTEETSQASAEIERFGESAVKQTRNLETLFAVVGNTSSDSMVHKDAVDELCKIYEEYGFKIDDEIDKLEQLRIMHDLVTDAIHKEGEERQKANLLASYEDALNEATDNMRNALQTAFDNAEWDGSGTFDDFDADEYREKAKELTHIIGAIVQAEGDNLATLTGEELESKIAEVNERIKKAYQDMGLQISKEFIKSTAEGDTYTIDAPVDVDAIQIMRDYAEATHSVTEGRKKLIESFEQSKQSASEESKEVSYSTMSIEDLARAASDAGDKVNNLGSQSASPVIDKISIDNATDAAEDANTSISQLNGLTAKPFIDTSSIGFAIGQTNTLLANMLNLQNTPMLGKGGFAFNPKVGLGKSNFSLGFNPNKFGFGQGGNGFGFGQQYVWGNIGGKNGVYQMPYVPITDPQILAQHELDNRINSVNSQKKVDDLLKEVNDALNKAEFDSDEYNRLETLKKRLEKKSRKNKGKSGSSSKNNKADKIESETRKLEDMQDDLEISRIRAAQDLEQRVINARLDAMSDGAEKVRLQQEQQDKEELEALERQKEDAINKYIEEERKIFEQQEKIKKTKNQSYKEKEFDENSVDTSSIANQYDELIKLAKDRQLKNAQKESLDAMRDYLKQYGSFEQQRLATTEEYEEKIAKAITDGERLSLQKEKKQKLASLTYENISMGIDWKALFSGVGSLSKDMLKPMMDKLQAYTQTDEYLDADSQSQQQVVELIQELRQYLGTDQSMTWQALDIAIANFTEAVGKYNQAVLSEKAALARREEAKDKLNRSEITQEEFDRIDAEAQKFGNATVEAKENMEGFAKTLNDTSEQVANYTSGLTAALNNMKGWKNIDGFGSIQQSISDIDQFKGILDSALPSMGNGIGKTVASGLSSSIGSGLSSIGNGLTSVISSGLGQTIGFIAQIPRLILDLVGSIKNFVTGVLDSFTELISLRWIDDLVNSILEAVGNLINAIFDLPENLWKVLESIVVNGIGGLLNNVVGRIGNILSFGVLSSGGPAEWFTNSNAKEVAETIEKLTDRNELLEQAIEDLTEEMEKSRGVTAIEFSRSAANLQEETNANYLQMAQAQAGYHGAHHSWGYYWDGFSQEQIGRLSNQIGRQWNGDIWNLSPEEMKILRSNVDMWEQIKNTGKGGYGGRVAEKLNDYIDQAGKLQEITDALYENLTTTTKENVFDDFLNSLYDLADGSEDVFDDIEDNWQSMVNRMVVNNIIGAAFQKKLENWYEELAKLNEARTNGTITDEEYKRRLENLKAQYNGFVEDAQKDVESLRDAGIIKATGDYDYEQEASSKGFQSMSQDTGEELNGRFTALQIAGENISAQAIAIYGQMIVMTSIHTSSNSYLLEIRNMMITANGYLEDIAKYSKKIYMEFVERLDDLVDNTKNI